MNTPAVPPLKMAPQIPAVDRRYIDAWSQSLFHFLNRHYWRIETKGLEHVPRQGAAILAGTHRGFVPWDAIMTLHLVVRHTGRVPRFLCHPGLLKFRPVARFVSGLGGVVACRENADLVLKAGELLGVLPEGVEGAFSLYRDAYRLGSFGRDDFIKMALRHRAPILPFVVVGSAEATPMLARIKSRWWTRHLDWPYLPVSTFPWLPVPLPSKWHIQFLPPVHAHEEYPPDAAHDRAVVKALSLKVRNSMQQALDEILRRRKSIFFGSVFDSRET
jgi:1-acyl-sn-glycerol-3-phosphate acyltransferase